MERLGPYLLGPNDTEENGIYCGDARVLSEAIPDESVDLIFTDPVYDRIDDYRWLAECGARVLKMDRACLVWYGIGYIDSVIFALSSTLSYRWQSIWYQLNNMQRADMGYCKYSGFFWYEKEKGRSKPHKPIQDLRAVAVTVGRERQDIHKWAKRTEIIGYYIDGFAQSRDIIFDPFTGGGTVPAVCKMLGRKYLAFEIDPDTCQLARQRVRQTQPPLFTLEPEQTRMEI